jgi:hypothetical protein
MNQIHSEVHLVMETGAYVVAALSIMHIHIEQSRQPIAKEHIHIEQLIWTRGTFP